MEVLSRTLTMIGVALLGGYLVQLTLARYLPHWEASAARVSAAMKRILVLLPTPVVLAQSFWILQMETWLVMMPLIGVLAHLIGGAFGFAGSRWLKLPPRQAGSMFTCGMLTNLGSFGSLICFMFFGEAGYVLAVVYMMLQPLVVFGVAFPLSSLNGNGRPLAAGAMLKSAIRDPYVVAPNIGLAVGLLLNASPWTRPDILGTVNEWLIIGSMVMMLISVGMSVRIVRMGDYLSHCAVIAGIKFLLVPLTIAGLAYGIGYAHTNDGLPFKVAVTMSAMPVAFNALIPPTLFNLDLDLANSCWLFTTALLAAVVPALYFLLG